MSIRTYFEEITTGKRRGIDAVFFRVIASGCSLMYILGVRLRLLLYTWGFFKGHSLEAKVISIGNITLGGAGKTPVVACLADRLRQRHCLVGVLSRGYGRKSKSVKIVSKGQVPLLDWQDAGDEPFLLAQRLNEVPVIVGANRVQAGQLAIETFNTDTLLLDDGYQHMKLQRNIDIVVIDASNPFGNQRVFPAGPLREPKDNLNRADVFWLTRIDQTDNVSDLINTLRNIQPKAGIIESRYRPIGLRNHESGAAADLSILQGARTILLCGIANPLSFHKTIVTLGAQVLRNFTFPDHHPFTRLDLERVQTAASQSGGAFIVTTEKDGVRIPRRIEHKVPIYELIIEVQITQGEDDLEKILWN